MQADISVCVRNKLATSGEEPCGRSSGVFQLRAPPTRAEKEGATARRNDQYGAWGEKGLTIGAQKVSALMRR
ncbi:hypothetical protein NDU88_003359 [Pleurodeles waltl]|uniref:Uncharacterized protein n=1 Tax=Pleurodeles waltl TaxID=8319 RepID=A0AAV7KX83_PLEWA|nr:hypothetical protein NDU88_003359 [Pleurodeles waltl]